MYGTREGRHTTHFLSSDHKWRHISPLFRLTKTFFVRYCFYSFFKYFTSFHSNFEPLHVVYKGLKYFILPFFKKNILWRYNRRKTIQDIFISSLSQENQTHLLAMLLVKNMFIFSCRLLNTRPVTYHLKVTV